MGFGKRLSDSRKAKGYSQEALGKLVGDMSKQGISHWETERYEPNLAQLARLCEVLDCSADWLILGHAPEGLQPDAVEQAKFFQRLSAGAKKRWKQLRPMFVDAVPDATVERRMPITAQDPRDD